MEKSLEQYIWFLLENNFKLFNSDRAEIYNKVIFILEDLGNNSEKFLSIVWFLYAYSLNCRKYKFAMYLAIIMSELIEKDKEFKIAPNYKHDQVLSDWKKNINVDGVIKPEDNQDKKIIDDYLYYSDSYYNLFILKWIKVDIGEIMSVSFSDNKKKLLWIDDLEKIWNAYLIIIKQLNNEFNSHIIDREVLGDKQKLKELLDYNQKTIIDIHIKSFNQEYYDIIYKKDVIDDNDKKVISYLLSNTDKVIDYTRYVLRSEINLLNEKWTFYDKDEDKIIYLIDILDKFYFFKYTLLLKNNDKSVESFLDLFRDTVYLASNYVSGDNRNKLNKIIDTLLVRINTAKHLIRD